jgi:hypothetical protein
MDEPSPLHFAAPRNEDENESAPFVVKTPAFFLQPSARIPKSKSSAAQPHGERTPLACGFRRLAENLVPQTFSRKIGQRM